MHVHQAQFRRLRAVLPLTVLALAPGSFPARGQTTAFATVKQFQSELDGQQQRYLRSQTELRTALQQAIGRIPKNFVDSDFEYERAALKALKANAEQLSKEAHAIIQRIDAHRSVSRAYVVSLTKAPATYQDLAAQFRQFAKEESYSDRKDDYVLFASVFDGLATRYRRAPGEVEPDIEAINELYPYLQSTELMLTRISYALDLLPEDPLGKEGLALEEQLRQFVQSFDAFRGAIHQLNQRLGGDGDTPRAAPKTPSSDDDNDRFAAQRLADRRASPAAPIAPKSPFTLLRTATAGAAVLAPQYRYPESTTTSRPTPSSWLAAKRAAPRNVLAFHVSGNDMIRREVLEVDVQEGEVYAAELSSGKRLALRVSRSMPSISTRTTTFWLAEPTKADPTVAAQLVAYRP